MRRPRSGRLEGRTEVIRANPGAAAMKLMWFHLMPYTELPEDFREKHPSVWVDIHSSLFDPRRAHLMYNDFMDELEFAAECGFDAVCVNEHHSNGYGLMPSPNLIASALSRRTTDTALCVMGNSLALYNPPTRVAEEFAMIDCISGGRLIAGFPVGSPMDTCYAYGQNPSMLRERYHEAHDLVLRPWHKQDTFAFYGRCLHVDPRFAGPPGYASEETQRRGIQSQVAQAAQLSRYESKFQMLAREMDAIVDKGYVIIGSPDEGAAQLQEVAKTLNVGHLMLLLQFGNMSKHLVKYNTQLFAEKVMPQLQAVFPEWEDRWWPKPMDRSARARLSPFQPAVLAAE